MDVRRTFPVALLGSALLSVACGDSNDSSKKNGSAGGPCAIKLSGEITGNLSCTVAVIYDGQDTGFGLTVQQSEPGASAYVTTAGAAKTGTFTDANCVECSISAFTSTGNPPPTWEMHLTPAKQGSFSVTIDSLGSGTNGANGMVAYPDPHGSATAVLPALQDTGATGTVNLSATF